MAQFVALSLRVEEAIAEGEVGHVLWDPNATEQAIYRQHRCALVEAAR
jgi:hypothetical protein